ncbi:hypothetical protein CBP31_10445 [Oceanisphaera profunda]|uniref:Autotransporter domain-containing protein n=1 Tax=Oceanisphaera profunda TaxID=1416627 RepID=A0A1Y0D745_9GAMM|nr:autotransporter outer membrane beta-barrel domain-containing protein [Oceanisphaera profunda]ART82996.1 hypothetical protein CBP31_10445 [Oceanisphaera profunda]
MTFNKSVLAAAVTVAISSPAFSAFDPSDSSQWYPDYSYPILNVNAGEITAQGTGSITIGSGKVQYLKDITRTTAKEDDGSTKEVISISNLLKNQRPSESNSGVHSGNALYFSKDSSLIELKDANLSKMDFDLRDANKRDSGSPHEEFLSEGTKSTFVLNNVTATEAFIETNGALIGHDGNSAAIEIKNSTLTGYDFDIQEDDEPIPDIYKGHKELLVNNGGDIVSDNTDGIDPDLYPSGGNAIDISGSNINGLIINEDWSGSEAPMKGGDIASMEGAGISVRDSEWHGGVINSSRNAVSTISGGTNGIEMINTKFVGAIINEALGTSAENRPVIAGDKRAILVSGGSFKGNIDNSGLLLVGNDYGYYEEDASEGAIVLSETRFEGDIVNSGEISNEDEFGSNSGKAAIVVERSQVIGNIINTGQIQGAIVVDGRKQEWTDLDELNQSSWKNTAGHGSMKGNIINTGNIQAGYTSSAIDIEGADFEGNIVNEGSINSMGTGVAITGKFVGTGTSQHDNSHHESASTMGIGIATANIINTEHASINSNGDGILLDSINFTGNIENAGNINSDYGSGIAIHGGHDQTTISLDKNELPDTKGAYGEIATHRSIVSKIVGNILNTETGHINSISSNFYTEGSTAIRLNYVDMDGDIVNHGQITANGNGIEITGGRDFTQKIIWNNSSGSQTAAIEGEWKTQTSTLKGNIFNSGDIQSSKHGIIINESAVLDGSIINNGTIQGEESGVTLAGGYHKNGSYISQHIWEGEGSNVSEEDRGQLEKIALASVFNGSITNNGDIQSQGIGIDLSNLSANASITNRGIIRGTETGINIEDDVTGNLTINQLAGELNGTTALRMNKVTRTNYTGGKIKGDVSNNGGTFYVEGNRNIAGDYVQTSGSTLAMGLHKEASLTANNIDLAATSKILIDLSQGNFYIQNGQEVALLKVNKDGVLTTDGVTYEVTGTNLVTVATTNTKDGKLVLTFDRTSFTEQVADAVKAGKFSGQLANNVSRMAIVLQRLDALAQSNPAIAKLLNSLDGSPESFTSLLPDVSGASVAGAMSAVSQSGSLVSVRATSLASGDMLDNGGMWVQGLVSKGDQDNRNGAAYDTKSNGFVMGADTKLNTGLVVGAAYSFINTDSTTQNSNTDSDYHMATAYASQAMDKILLDGQAYYAWGDNDSSRNIGTTANYDSSLYGARVGAGYQYDVAPATHLIPTLSLEASRLSVDGYTETGLAGLKVDSQNFNRLELGLNTELSKDYQLRNAMLTPSVNLGVFHDFEGEAQNSTVAFAAAPAETFNVTGTKPEKTRYVAGVGLDIVSNEVLTVSAEYNYNWNTDGFDANSGALKFRWDF